MSLKSDENGNNTTDEDNSESEDDFVTDGNKIFHENTAIFHNKEKFITEKELADKCAENKKEINYLDRVDLILHDTQILRPSFQNISASYADEVPFLVDGDSLLITLMNDKNWSYQLGGTTLHLVYLFERYLNIFKERGGTFYIVFFECWRNIWKENWSVLLYRLVLMNHIKKNTSYAVHLFDNCFDERFLNFISYIRPGFILFNMDSYISCSHLENIDKTNLRNLTNIHLIMWLYFEMPCINTNFIEVDISVVKGYYLETNTSIRAIVNEFNYKFKSYINELSKTEDCIDVKLIKNSSVDSVRRMVFLNAAAIFNEINKDDDLIRIFFLTEALKEYLQLKNRCCSTFTTNLRDLNMIVNIWHKCMYFALSKIEMETCDWLTVSDIWQGLLFGHVCRFVVDGIKSAEDLGIQLAKIYENIINDFNSFGYCLCPYPIQLSIPLNLNWEILTSPEINQIELNQMPLIPIQNSLVLEFCGDILHNIKWTQPPPNLFMNTIYTEDHHFHFLRDIHEKFDSLKDIFDNVPTDPWLYKKYLKNLNSMARHMTIYGSSIEGRPLEYSSVFRNFKTKKNGKKVEQKPQKQSKKAQIIINQRNEDKANELEKDEKEYVDLMKESLKKSCANLVEILNNINKMIIKIRPNSTQQLQMLFLKLKVLMGILKETPKLKEKEILEYKKNIYLCCHKILIFKPLTITEIQKKLLSKSLTTIDCDEIARRNGLLANDDASVVSDNIDDSWIRFQLEKLGPELVRNVTGEPDPRAKKFIPDPWQKKLFDIVDKKESAVIVAPTSSGKTYASYYCMESVLRESANGHCIYVAPTKALVNQVAATVYARFKDTKMAEGMAMYGVFTGDYKMNATNSQILVTIPQALEILLTSPRQYSWLQNLKYVIFDEVHCIAGHMGAVAFERCLLLIRCPFLALSATIRNPRLIQSWLQKAENFKQLRDIKDAVPKKQSYKVNLVEHLERHSDLIKYRYGSGELHHLHPYAHLDNRVIQDHEGIPNHMVLSPAETIQLYDAMLFASNQSDQLHNLSPKIYFSSKPENGFISRNMVQDYANDLRQLLELWLKQDSNSFKKTITYLKPINSIVGRDHNYILENIVEFVLNLERQNMLPAIIFTYNRSLIQEMTEILTKHFMNSKIESMNRHDEKKITKKEKLEKKLNERESAKQKLETSTKRFSKTLNLISDHSEKSFQGIGKMTSDDVKYIENQLLKAGFKSNDIWTNAIRNGIMMHHNGLGAKIRSSVEMLFRSRILNVVFATGTLALGIHMPCKTTVIVGNSVHLNSLQYHQMAGRAGRRGYDTTGNVIFFGINPRKQHSLLTAKLPELKGNYPVTVSFILRLMLLATNVTDKGKKSEIATKITISRLLTLLENPLNYMHNPNLKINVKYFFSFSLQFLKIQEYINDEGEAFKWVGLVTHLDDHEPGNFALVHLLRSGAIRKLCTNNKDAQKHLIIVLSHLFNRISIDSSSRKKFKKSKVILEPLPDFIRQSLELYNEQVKFIFDQYLLNVVTHFNNEDNQLPLSSVKFVGKHSPDDGYDNTEDNLQNKFLNMCTPNLVCSSFAGLSGNGDNNLYSTENLISNIKQKMSTDVKVIPIIDLNTELNSYVLDFYTNCDDIAIRNDNGLKDGQEFTYLKEFLVILKTIITSLEIMGVSNEYDVVYTNFKKLENRYNNNFHKAFSSASF